MADGLHVLLLRSFDAAGNLSVVRQYEYIVDTTPPNPVVDAPSVTNDPQIRLAGTAGEDGATITVVLNGLPAERAEDGDAYLTGVLTLEEGGNTVVGIATDAAGNVAETPEQTILLDTVPPRVSFLAPISGSTVQLGATTLQVRIEDLSGVKPDSVILSLNGVTVDPIFGADDMLEYVSPAPFTAEADGSPMRHFVLVLAEDAAGNVTRDSMSFTVDGEAPSVAALVPGDGELVAALEPTISAVIVGDDLDIDSVEVLFGPVGTTLTVAQDTPNFEFAFETGQFVYFPLLDDQTTYQVVVRASDNVGNAMEATWTFDVDSDAEDVTAPSVAVLFPTEGGSVRRHEPGSTLVRH